MLELPGPILLLILIIAAAAPLNVLYVMACRARNQTNVHDLRAKVAHLRAEYEERRRVLDERKKGGSEEIIYAEVVEPAPARSAS